MTIIGILFLLLMLLSFYFPLKYTVAILLLSTVFSASSVLNVGEKSIMPYLLCSVLCSLKILFKKKGFVLLDKLILRYGMLFVVYSVIVTLVGPVIFQGMEVVGSDLDDNYYNGYERLTFTIGNVAQLIYLTVNVFTLLLLYSSKDFVPNSFLEKVFYLVVELTLIFGYWEFLSKITGLLPFPSEILLNSIGQGQSGELNVTGALGVMRMSSLYSEASYLGAFLAASFWALMYMPVSYRRSIDALFVLLAILLNVSGTGIVTFLGGFVLFVYSKHFQLRFLLTFFCMCLFSIVLISQIEYSDVVYDMIANKMDSQSGEVRFGTTMRNVEILFESFFFGVGRGSTRSSSFIIDLLATVGIIGTITFFSLYCNLIRDKFPYSTVNYVYIFCIVLLIGQFVAIPDFSYSAMWFGLYLSACKSV